MSLDGERVPRPFVQSEHDESGPVVSSDGRFLAYYSNETGRDEIYVRTIPDGARWWQISTSRGIYPRWNPRGGEILYARGNEIVTVPLQVDSDLHIGSERRFS